MKLAARHYTFIGLFLVVAVAMSFPTDSEVTISTDTQGMFNFIDSLPEGSIILVSFDHEASSLPEIQPLALATLRHAFSRDHRLIGVALLAEGTGIGYRLLRTTAQEYGKEYGDDYVYLGFKPQYIAAILAMGESIENTFPQDYLGSDYDELPMLATVTNYDEIAAVLSISDGSLTTHWIEYGRGRYGVTVITATAAAMVTTYDPYLASGQLSAMVSGLRGAAEYEQLIGRGGAGLRGMLAQTSAHLYVILMIIIGNVMYFRSKGKKKKGKA